LTTLSTVCLTSSIGTIPKQFIQFAIIGTLQLRRCQQLVLFIILFTINILLTTQQLVLLL